MLAWQPTATTALQNAPLHTPPSPRAQQICNVLTALVLSAGLAFVYLLAYGLPHLAAYLPPSLYCTLLGLLLFPGPLLYRDNRMFFGLTLWRVATPIRPVSWSDFLLADILTSLAKAISDTERAVCHLTVGPVMQANIKVGWLQGGWRGPAGFVGWLEGGCPGLPVLDAVSVAAGGGCVVCRPCCCLPAKPRHVAARLASPSHDVGCHHPLLRSHPSTCRPAATPRLCCRWALRRLTPGAWCSAFECTSTQGPARSSSMPSSTQPPSQ